MKWGGPQNVVHENEYEEKEKHQLKVFFNELSNTIKGADALTIFGPSYTFEKFRNELLENSSICAITKLCTGT